MRFPAPVGGLLLALWTASAPAAGVLKLPLEDSLGINPEVINGPDGTKIEWTEFFRSSSSNVEVGRSTINGPLMPASNLDYTDCFLIVRGSSTIIVEGKTYHVRAGDIVLLPRGANVEGRDFKDYVHFAASFETQPDAKSHGPKKLRLLRPDLLKGADFTVEGHNMRHVYYEGAGGVVVRAWQSTEADMTTEFFNSLWSELSFITAGSGTITNEDGSVVDFKAGDAIFIAKGQKVKIATHQVRKLAVVFDQQAPSVAQAAHQHH